MIEPICVMLTRYHRPRNCSSTSSMEVRDSMTSSRRSMWNPPLRAASSAGTCFAGREQHLLTLERKMPGLPIRMHVRRVLLRAAFEERHRLPS